MKKFCCLIIWLALCHFSCSDPDTENEEFNIKMLNQPLSVSSCPGGGNAQIYYVPVDFSPFDFERDSECSAGCSNGPIFNKYANNIRFDWNLSMESSFYRASFGFAYSNIENNYDFLRFYEGNHLHYNYTGLNFGYNHINFNSNPNFNKQNDLRIEWDSDSVVSNETGFKINTVKLWCSPNHTSQNSSSYMRVYQPVDGLLPATGSTLYYRVTWNSDKKHILHLNRRAGDGDFDVYVKRGYSGTPIYPSSTNYDYRGIRGKFSGTDEMISEKVVIPSQSSGYNTLWIAVKSYSGKGHFRMRLNRIDVEQTYTVFRPASASGINVNELLVAASRAMYAATDGKVLTHFAVKTNTASCGGDCDLHLIIPTPNKLGSCNTSSGTSSVRYDLVPYVFATTYVHEVGHCKYSMPNQNSGEEYYQVSGDPALDYTQCGHSAMGNGDADLWRGTKDFCTSTVHTKDRATYLNVTPPSMGPGDSMWKILDSQYNIKYPWHIQYGRVPDPYEYYQPDPSNSVADTTDMRNDTLFPSLVQFY